MNKNAKRFLIASGVLAAAGTAAAVVSHAVTTYLLKVALDREEPKMISERAKTQLTGFDDSSPEIAELTERGKAAAERLKAEASREVCITAPDGITLVGHLYEAKNAERTIIAMHGWRSSWLKDFGIISEFWHKNGCNVLYAEQRGQGESGGDYMGFGMLERYDCLEWIKWLEENGFSEAPIYLAGISMGAATVLMTAGFELPANIKGIMADCGFTSAHAIWEHVMKSNMRINLSGLLGAVASDLCKKKIDLASDSYSTLEAMKECQIPVLFIHGTDDHFVPIEMTYENYKACAADKKLLVVPGAEHGLSYIVDPISYEKAVEEFWQHCDTAAPEAEISEEGLL